MNEGRPKVEYVTLKTPSTILHHEQYGGVIDMGLSVKWASCNLGANSPEGLGDYYAWGEVKPKKQYNWKSYKWSGDDYDTQIKYNPKTEFGKTDWKHIIETIDDAARNRLGGQWRIPTLEEWDELFHNSDISYVIYKGISGNMFMSKKNGNAIFLPFAGMRYDDQIGDIGKFGLYWSSSLDKENPDRAWSADMGISGSMMFAIMRYRGYSIRPVRKY